MWGHEGLMSTLPPESVRSLDGDQDPAVAPERRSFQSNLSQSVTDIHTSNIQAGGKLHLTVINNPKPNYPEVQTDDSCLDCNTCFPTSKTAIQKRQDHEMHSRKLFQISVNL